MPDDPCATAANQKPLAWSWENGPSPTPGTAEYCRPKRTGSFGSYGELQVGAGPAVVRGVDTAAEIVRKAIRAGSSFYGELTLADAQRGIDALRAAGWSPPAPPRGHHEGTWRVDAERGECGCECPRCYVGDVCVCPDCTYDHDHSRRDALNAQ